MQRNLKISEFARILTENVNILGQDLGVSEGKQKAIDVTEVIRIARNDHRWCRMNSAANFELIQTQTSSQPKIQQLNNFPQTIKNDKQSNY